MSTVIVLLGLFIAIIGMKSTTIAISKNTRDSIASLGSKGQTYDEILNLLLDKWNEAK